jgi:mannosyltransferase
MVQYQAPRRAVRPISPLIARWSNGIHVWRQRFIVVATLLACAVGVTFISITMLIHGSLQLDEAQSLWQTSHSFTGTLRTVASDVHVPFYHVILHFWQLIFGGSIEYARIISLIFLIAAIPVVYLLAREVLTMYWALFATILVSFSPFMNWYANVARMYTLLAFFAVLSQYLFIRLVQRKKNWVVFGLTAIIGAYTHYFFSFNLVAEGIYFLVFRKRFAPGSLRRFLIIGCLVALALSPWLFYFHSLGSAGSERPKLALPTTIDFFNVYSQFLFGFQNDHVNTILVSCWPVAMLFGLLAIRRNFQTNPQIAFIANMAFMPVLIAYTLSFVVTPFFLSRYLICSLPPLIIFIVWLIASYGKVVGRVLAILMIGVLIATSLQQNLSSSTPVKEDYHDAVAYINAHATIHDIVIVSTPFTIYPVEYYYTSHAAITTLPTLGAQFLNLTTLPNQVVQLNSGHTYVYILLSYDQGYEKDIKQYYLGHFKQVSQHVYSHDLALYVFQVGYVKVAPIGSPITQITPYDPSLAPSSVHGENQ